MSTELEQVRTAVLKGINEGSISLSDLALALSSKTPESPQEAPIEVLPAVITDRQSEALQRLPEVFGKVVPTSRRALDGEEVHKLLSERDEIDILKKMLDHRRDDIRTTVLNSFDVSIENQGLKDLYSKDKDGHYLAKMEVIVEDKKFAWEVSTPDPKVNIQKLQELLSPEEWESVTIPVRVFDEDKVLEVLKDHPELLEKIEESVEVSKPIGRFNIRKA